MRYTHARYYELVVNIETDLHAAAELHNSKLIRSLDRDAPILSAHRQLQECIASAIDLTTGIAESVNSMMENSETDTLAFALPKANT